MQNSAVPNVTRDGAANGREARDVDSATSETDVTRGVEQRPEDGGTVDPEGSFVATAAIDTDRRHGFRFRGRPEAEKRGDTGSAVRLRLRFADLRLSLTG